jgi:hypothetical protein
MTGRNGNYDPKLFIRSDYKAPRAKIPIPLQMSIYQFTRMLTPLFKKRRSPNNLLPSQRTLLHWLAKNEKYIIAKTDKNLGPAIMLRTTYVQRALTDHLLDPKTYRRLTPQAADGRINVIRRLINNFITCYEKKLPRHEITFLKRSLLKIVDPFPHFYILMKIHKTPWKTRPIVSVSGSLTHGLGKWVDRKLQPICRRLRSFIDSSLSLKKALLAEDSLPATARLFTADAISMYTNIDTTHALATIGTFLRTSHLCRELKVRPEPIMKALEIIMRHNVFKFGDTYWLQLTGTAMGTPPAPMYATLYFAIKEELLLWAFQDHLLFYKRYIDDVIGIWDQTKTPREEDQWTKLQQQMDTCGSLRWEFTERLQKVDFLDMTISLENSTIKTKLYEKQLNLYLYVPPSSAHSPGILNGLIYGMLLRIYRLTTDPADCQEMIQNLYNRLVARGYNRDTMLPIFQSAHTKIHSPAITDDTTDSTMKDAVILHLPFHPFDPKRKLIQSIFADQLLQNWSSTPLWEQKNHKNRKIGIRRMIVAYHRPKNLANHLVPRRIERTAGPLVSTYCNET